MQSVKMDQLHFFGVIILFVDLYHLISLLIACSTGKINIVKELLKSKANIEADDYSGCTALTHGN
jgi:hypothetical protein